MESLRTSFRPRLPFGKDQMLYSVTFLSVAKEIETSAVHARSSADLAAELKRLVSEFRRRRPGTKDTMSVSAEPNALGR